VTVEGGEEWKLVLIMTVLLPIDETHPRVQIVTSLTYSALDSRATTSKVRVWLVLRVPPPRILLLQNMNVNIAATGSPTRFAYMMLMHST
jgi:hypothetical protein